MHTEINISRLERDTEIRPPPVSETSQISETFSTIRRSRAINFSHASPFQKYLSTSSTRQAIVRFLILSQYARLLDSSHTRARQEPPGPSRKWPAKFIITLFKFYYAHRMLPGLPCRSFLVSDNSTSSGKAERTLCSDCS